jgi:ABC-type lipoprotein export system ATPase subunit
MEKTPASRLPVVEETKPSGPLISLSGVKKTYRTGKIEYVPIRGVDIEINSGDMVSVVGYSGSGKSTILNLRLESTGQPQDKFSSTIIVSSPA